MSRKRRDWEIEHIPDPDELYIRLCEFHYNKRRDEWKLTAFRPKRGDCGRKSAYWKKYVVSKDEVLDATTEERCRHNCASIKAGEIRSVDLVVEHSPDKDETNISRAHSEFHSQIVINESQEPCDEIEYESPTTSQLQELLTFALKIGIYRRE